MKLSPFRAAPVSAALAVLGAVHCGGAPSAAPGVDASGPDALQGGPDASGGGVVPAVDGGGRPDASGPYVGPAVDGGGAPDSAGTDAARGDACAPFSTVTTRRPVAMACAPTPAPDAALPPYGGGNLDGGSPDLCLVDGDCSDGGTCSCRGATRGWAGSSNGNVCIPGNCRTDSDCGPGGACSPTVDPGCGGFYGVQGYYCHTCADRCTSDGDCASRPDGGPAGYCAFDPAVGYWACGYGFCAG